jgi:hypothetical protein
LTIVGGRPRQENAVPAGIPRGIEVLLKKASVDPDFRLLLLERRAEAARAIDLDLNPAERAMLQGIPQEQLEAIIARTTVEPEQRRAFLGRAAAVMLGALVGTRGCEDERHPTTLGIQP